MCIDNLEIIVTVYDLKGNYKNESGNMCPIYTRIYSYMLFIHTIEGVKEGLLTATVRPLTTHPHQPQGRHHYETAVRKPVPAE